LQRACIIKRILEKEEHPLRSNTTLPLLAACCIAAAGATILTCSNPVDKRVNKPQLSIVADTTVSVKDSIVLHVFNVAGSGRALNFVWSLDSRRLNAVPSPDSVCRLFFGIQDTGAHLVTVTALGQGNTESDPETTKVLVLLDPPVVHFVTRDTVISANDSVLIVANATDPNGSVIAYRWLIDTSTVAVVSANGTLSYWFGAQSATHRVRVAAMDDDSILSTMDSVHIRVAVYPPQISVPHDTTIPINDTLVIHAIRLDTFSTAIRWVWAKDGPAFSDTTSTGSCSVRFARTEAGDRRVFVKAIDSHRIESNVDSVHVLVMLDPPRVSIVHDTIVPINDPAVLHAHGSDTNGFITRYVWALDGVHFADTTAGDSIVHVYSRIDTGKSIVVLVKVFDDDTLESNTDSVHIVVRLKPSPLVAITSDTSVFINDTFTVAAQGSASGSKSPITWYVWAVDKIQFDDTTRTGFRSLIFRRLDVGRHVVRVKAIDRDTMESLAESLVVQVRLGAPSVAAMRDTAVFINDTALVHALGTDSNGSVVRYLWAIDGGPFTDTTAAGVIKKVWSKQGAGVHVLRVMAVDDDTILSTPASCTVTVRLGTPVVTAMRDTAVFINDTVVVHASGSDTNGSVMRYAWAVDGGPFTDTTIAGTIKKVWAKQSAGQHTVRVIAIDNDSISSRQDSVVVTVRLGMPVLKAVHDTAVTWGTTLAVVLTATDTNGTIQQYFADTAGSGTWTDSSVHDTLRFSSSVHCRKMAIVGVRDNDGLVTRDTFFIDYKAVQCTVSASGLNAGDTVYCLTKNHRQGAAPLSFSARRVDAVKDTFSYTLWSGPSASSLVQSYHGSDTACTLKTLDTGTYYWRIVAVDTHNDTMATPVSSVYGLFQRRICFIGHSIITGLGCNSGRGGMRRTVIDTLRANAGIGKRFWCEGPLFSSLLLPAQDDSCLAVGGKTSSDIYDSLRVYSATIADIWVYMNGANEGYRFPTADTKYGIQNYQLVTIDSMHARNPQAEIYVFNGLPFPPAVDACFTQNLDTIYTVHLPIFNQMLDTAITHRCATWQGKGEAGVWLVDANTPMSLANGFYNPAYFWDCQHPNQAGYDIMSRELFKVMRLAKSSFIK
jgi:hypothetical protein